jgi:hypothetical protein
MVRSLRRSPGATGLRGGDPQHGARTMAASVHRKSKRCGGGVAGGLQADTVL